MEGTFLPNGPEGSTIWAGFPAGGADKANTGRSATNMAASVTSQNHRGADTATLVGVVPEPVPLEALHDEQLLAAVAHADTAAFEELYDRHVGKCFGLALTFVHEPSQAEDIVQEVFTKVWSHPESFSPGRGTFRVWLLTVVRNQALDKLRQIRRTSALHMLPSPVDDAGSDTPVDVLADTAPTPHDQAWTKEIAGVVRRALGQLPASEYQAITLAYFGGLTQQEIADKLQQPLGTVKTRTRSALRRLHHFLAAQSALSE